MERPKLRYGLELLPFREKGEQRLVLRDRQGYSDRSLVLSPHWWPVLAAMDGTHTIRDLQVLYTRRTGELLFSEQLRQLTEALDNALFLENERFLRHVALQVAAFQREPVRAMQHAGKSYPEDPQALKQQLAAYFDENNGGPGPLQPGRDPRRATALVAPHIDIRAGGPCFAHAYKAVLDARAPTTWVILATGHEPVENYFAATAKDFQTPLGVVRCHRRLVDQLVDAAPRDLTASEYNHRSEHTVEFQAVFLAYLQPRARIVPLLCSFSWRQWDQDREYIDTICTLLRRLATEQEGAVGFLASVDLAHIGPRYGDSSVPTQETIAYHLRKDRELLAHLEACDSDAFMATIREEDNRRQVCGVAPLCVLSRVLAGRSRGQVLQHRYAVVDQQGSFVTFAGMAFFAV